MRRVELDYILSTMLSHRPEVSDLNFTVDRPPQIESESQLLSVPLQPPIERLSPYQTEMIALNLIGGHPRLLDDLLRTGSCDTSYTLEGKARFRVNVFSQRGNYSVVMRKLNTRIPTLDDLKMPDVLREVARERIGLILVTGPTGSGKSTTLAAIIDHINDRHPVHVITLEDPVEYVYTQKLATINQRELGIDFDSYSNGLRAALRQAPKIILVGEMRDRTTIEIALSAAETGHLVLSTLHTTDVGQTINRILGMFAPEEQEEVRRRLADSLKWVVGQRLAPKIGGSRWALLEIMGANLRTKESIQLGESEGKSFYEIIEASYPFGWRTFDHSCLQAYEEGLITEETAVLFASKRGIVSRGIDNIKKKRGEHTTDVSLRVVEPQVPRVAQSSAMPKVFKIR